MKHTAKLCAVFSLFFLFPSTALASSPVYVVSAGDTLSKIAREHHTTVQQLIQVNQLATDRLAIGQMLLLPEAAAVQSPQPAAVNQERDPADAVESVGSAPKAMVHVNVLNVRQQPSTSSRILGKLLYGMMVDVLESGQEWTKIAFSGTEAYVASEYITVQTNVPSPEKLPVGSEWADRLLEIVQPLLHTPYVLGGNTPDGFDCSGFTAYVYRQLGILLPRTSEEQFLTGQAVSLEEAIPGDLLFYDSLRKGRVSHVAMYMGNGMIVHANGTEVRFEKLENMHKLYPFYGVKRYLSK
jgi:peptidoglycan endopeptidase LytE